VNHGFTRQISLENDGYDTPEIARETIGWLKANGDHPFMLYVHFNGPHAPYRAPLTDIFKTFPGISQIHSYADTLLWLYQSEVSYTDRYVGKVLDAIDQLGLADRTVVALTADHGDQQRPHHYLGNTAAPDFTGAFFDHGATLLNDEIHVPLAIRAPGLAPRRVDDYVSALDAGPTFLEMFQIPGREECAGQSLVPYMQGTATAALKNHVLGSEGFQGRAIVFDGRYKYIRSYEATNKRVYSSGPGSGDMHLYFVPEQLYDLAQDQDEEHNLVDENAALLARAREIYGETFKVQDSYELVVESAKSKPVDVLFPPGTHVDFEEGEGHVVQEADGVRLTGKDRARYVLEIKDLPQAVLPEVHIGGQAIHLAMTSMKLPLDVTPTRLPLEDAGRYTLYDPAPGDVAYLRRVEDDGRRDRRIQTGNPAFDKVLRQWGYLNDK